MMKRVFLGFCFWISVYAQSQTLLQKAHTLYQYGMYTESLRMFEKALNTTNLYDKASAYIGAAQSAERLNQFTGAEVFYLNYFKNIPDSIQTDTAKVLLASVLIINENYAEAEQILESYFKIHPQYRINPKLKSLQLAISQRLHFIPNEAQSEYTVEQTELSTKNAEYAPFVHKKSSTLWFIRESKFYDFVNLQSDQSAAPPVMELWKAEIKNQKLYNAKNPTALINPDKHLGPIVFTQDGTKACYVETQRFAALNTPVTTKLYMAIKPPSVSIQQFQNHIFKYAKPAPFNSDSFFISYPAFSPLGNELVFSTNRPGSVGGKDLWSVSIDTLADALVCSDLKPLGPDLNTTNDEVYPFFKSQDELFFSSNGHPGFGGYDIFSARRINAQWILLGNEGLKLNSGADDFGISFLNDSTGYFASNRKNGKGKDDIYKFHYKKRLTEVKGILWYSQQKDKPVGNTWVFLRDEKGKVIDSVKTNRKGFFVFRQLPVGTKYMVTFSEDTNMVFSNYVLSDENGIISDKPIERLVNGSFGFKNLPLKNIVETPESTALMFLGRITTGQEVQMPLKNAEIKLRSDNGVFTKTAITSENGTFLIREIPPDIDYDLLILKGDSALSDGTRINLYSRDGKLLRVLFKTSSAFSFKLLQSDRKILDELDISDEHTFSGKLVFGNDHKALQHVSVDLIDENGKVLETVFTDSLGRFVFNDLPQDKAFSISLNPNSDQLPEGELISLANRKGEILRNFLKEKNRFVYKHVSTDRKLLSQFELDDPEAFSVNLYGCFFDQNQRPLANRKFKILKTTNDIVITTDAEGKFNLAQINPYEDFSIETLPNDTTFNLVTRIFMTDQTGQVIKVAQLQFGKFQFKMLQSDRKHMTTLGLEDGPVTFKSTFTDSDLPLRFIGKIGVPKLNVFLKNVTVRVVNANGTVVDSVITNTLGQFIFENLPKDRQWSFELDRLPDNLPPGSVLVLYDNTSKIIQQFTYENNHFVFKVLPSNIKSMADLISELPENFSTELYGYLLNQKRVPLASVQFKVQIEGSDAPLTIQTDKMGRFSLKNLNPYLNYNIETDPNDSSFKHVTRIYITDQQKQIIKVADISHGRFSFKIVQSDRILLSEMNTDVQAESFSADIEAYAKIAKPVVSKATYYALPHIYYHFGEVQYDSASTELLKVALDSLVANAKLKLKIESHTDAISPEYYNLDLSIRRALYIRKYFISNGIAAQRISYKGFGESKLLNACKDNVECPEENHRVNRRSELFLYSE